MRHSYAWTAVGPRGPAMQEVIVDEDRSARMLTVLGTAWPLPRQVAAWVLKHARQQGARIVRDG